MRTFLIIIAILFIIGWVFGFIIYSVGAIIHLLLVLAIIAIVVSFLRREPK